MTNVLRHISSWQTILDFKKLFSIDWNRCCVQPCVSSSSCAVRQKGKKAQNWGFEITNVRYGHQAAFCSHFNDGSNSCFQTTNWIATLHGNGHFGQHLCGLFLQPFSLIIIIADSCPTATLMKWDLKKFWGANFAKVAFHPTLELSTFKYWEIKSGSEEQKLS